ncbi:MAG: S9 family peptidase [Nocardioidaceae bacterium]|nr:S9 family peptidase [Nocardioidaceae bacterium]NUS51830.1 S9 family peptidase [Nocardioidaceae bacterium]
MTLPHDLQALVRDLLDIRVWTAFDIDDEGRVLAGTDDLGSLQLVEIAPDGTRTPLTDLPSRCSGRYVPGRRAVVVEHDNGGDEHMQLSLLDLAEPLGRPAAHDDLQPLVADPAHMHNLQDVTETSLVYSTNRRNDVDMDVVVRDLATGEERVVFDEGGYVAETVVSHDGRSTVVNRLSLQPNSMVVGVVGPDGSRPLTDEGELAYHEQVAWSADDDAVVMSSNHDRELTAVVRLTLDGDWQVLVEDPGHDLLCWASPDGTALVVGTLADGAVRLAVHEADGTKRCDVDLPAKGLADVRWAADGSRFLVSLNTPTDPGSLHRVDAATGTSTVVVDGRDAVPPALRDRLTTPTVHRVPTPDGERVPCFLYAAAPDGDPGLAGASVVHVHGGPEAAANRIFSPVLQALSLLGFAVLVPNVRGSTGYGKRWYSLDDVEKRLDSVADLAALHDWLPSQDLDAGRSALWGGSYGGYMVLAGVSMQPDRWAAGVDIVGMSSLVTFLENTSGYRRAFREREYGSLEHHRDLLEKASPISYLHQMVAPLFVIHGANDPRVPLSEAEQITAALEAKGVECELRVYHDEGHGLAKRVNRLDAYPAAMGFLARVLDSARR